MLRLKTAGKGKERFTMRENYIFPFLWMRGEEERILRNEMEKIDESGIGAVCLEARPHPDFAGDGWWHDVDIVLDEAKKRDMKVWILDDSHFPTGQANGRMSGHAKLCRRYIHTNFVDATGPVPAANADINLLASRQVTWMDLAKPVSKPLINETRLLSVSAAKIMDKDTLEGDLIDLTGFVENGVLTWDIPAGTWRIFVSCVGTDLGSRPDFINYIDRDSARVQIDEVYEKHYRKYASEFGKTIAGFFSDEPGFYNTDSFGPDNKIGLDMALPWGAEMEADFAADAGDGWKKDLPLLWNEACDGRQSRLRYLYMDHVSRLFKQNFSCQIGDWCRQHGVMYIGHVVEDSLGYMRLGCGAGHYFRAVAGQDMAGIDNIGCQIMPGNDASVRHTGFSDIEGSFYHFQLGKLGASAAAIDPKKQGRLMCETFGAYGWREGVRDMKWLTDYLISQGVNHFVPHAFSMAEYPDNDCPPHFYARGNNPEFPFFGELMRYMNRLCSLFSGGMGMPSVGVLFEADSDWAGDAMTGEKTARVLLEHQTDFIYLPADVFKTPENFDMQMKGSRLVINGRQLQALVIGEAEYIPADALHFLKEHPEFPAFFVNRLPEKICGGPAGETMPDLTSYPVVRLEKIADALKETGIADTVSFPVTDKNLRFYHYRKDGHDNFFFMNASLSETVDLDVHMPAGKMYSSYDAFSGRWTRLTAEEGILHLKLEPYMSAVVSDSCSDAAEPGRTEAGDSKKSDALCSDAAAPGQKASGCTEKSDLLCSAFAAPGQTVQKTGYLPLTEWQVTLHETGQKQSEDLTGEFAGGLRPVSSVRPDFSGQIDYRTTINLKEAENRMFFRAEYVFECMEVTVNGVNAGMRIAPPYTLELTGLLRKGENEIIVKAATTALRNANTHPGIFGKERTVIEPTGMFGKTGIAVFDA